MLSRDGQDDRGVLEGEVLAGYKLVERLHGRYLDFLNALICRRVAPVDTGQVVENQKKLPVVAILLAISRLELSSSASIPDGDLVPGYLLLRSCRHGYVGGGLLPLELGYNLVSTPLDDFGL